VASDHHGFIPSGEEDVLRQRVKIELRKRMRGLRKTLPASACAERSLRIAERLGEVEGVTKARTVALFWPIEDRHEVDLRGLDARLRERGVRIAYPAVDPETRAMTFRFVSHPDEMQEHAFGFREPASREREAAPGELDVIVVPALAIDPRGHRIGYGAGYYDQTLTRYAPPALTIAVAFDFQLVAEVPDLPHDVPAGWLTTDARSFASTPLP
jgi:5-formyltetrahydrofolate cyclo-ligase